MKSLVLLVATLALSLGLAIAPGLAPASPSAWAGGVQPMPAATTKKPPKASATPSGTSSATPAPAPTGKSAVEEEGDRWLQLAVVGGGGLLAAVLVFFGIGALLRRRPRPEH
jgi:hypothetical protein